MTNAPIDLLLVDDSEDDSTFFCEALREAAIEVRVLRVRDGAEALSVLLGEAPDEPLRTDPKLIVLDLKMPKVSGLELLQKLKTHPLTQPIPIVVFSSSQEKRDLIESYQLGANSYLVKPMDPDAFGEAVCVLGRYWFQFNQIHKP